METQTSSIYKNNWFHKIFILIILMCFLSFSLYFYYKSLNNIKHKELEGR
jgi:hypothetical protein